MKISFLNLLFALFIIVSLFCSCKQKLSHDEALNYYSSIITEVNKAISETDSYIGNQVALQSELKNLTVSSALNNRPAPSNKSIPDPLKFQHNLFLKNINENIEALQKVIEKDNHIHLKLKSITYLTKTKELHIMLFQNTLKSLSDPILTENQNSSKKLIEESIKNDWKKHSNIFIKSVQEYQRKYNISDDEAKKYDL